ncbi:MAG TPA: STAS domain-containing protein [Chitinophagales bacterium]|nr:STAS domain-containing protein [Chitinophagales bacterium]HRK26069.1 STAS domain-containing protein [Chitinophagales bacterium]
MKFTLDKKESYTIITVLEDKLDTLNSADFKTELKLLNEGGVSNMVIDLSKVDFVDSSGLGSILVGNRLCQGSEGTLVVTGLNANVQKLISISRLDGVLTITPTAQEAVDIVMMDELMRELAQEEQADEESVLDETLEED